MSKILCYNNQGINLFFMNNLRLYLIVFFCGAVSMALEITAGRFLASNYGNGTEVWGSIIGIILIGLVIGYFLGGYMADKRPDDVLLGFFVSLAGFWIVLIPFLYNNITPDCVNCSQAYSSLITTSILFLIPSVLLGTISPFAIKLKIKKIETIGGESGSLYAVATLGSVAGTFLSAFGLIIWLPLNMIFSYLGICLLLISIMLLYRKLFYLICIIVFIIGAIFLGAKTHPVEDTFKTLFSKQSLYGDVIVREKGSIRSMYIDNGIMGAVDMKDRFKSLPNWSYDDLFEIIALLKNGQDVLNLGVGPGLIASRLSEKDGLKVDAVDINKDVLDAAQMYFGLNSLNNLNLYNEDARVFLKKTDKQYDVIEMDAFKYNNGIYSIPPQLTTSEFFNESKNHLKKDGTFVMMAIDYPKNFVPSEFRTLQSVFTHVYSFNCSSLYVFVAGDTALNLDSVPQNSSCTAVKVDSSKGIIFTDNFVPILGN